MQLWYGIPQSQIKQTLNIKNPSKASQAAPQVSKGLDYKCNAVRDKDSI